MEANNIILTETSPNGNIEAIVEQDDRVASLYLYGSSDTDFGVKACWIRNLRSAPDGFEGESIKQGNAPMLPRQFCRHPDGAPALVKDAKLSFVWFEEGDAVALLEGASILSIIPGWSSLDGFHGFARDCRGDAPICSELDPDSNVLVDRIHRAQAFWRAWQEEPGPWPKIQGDFCSAIERQIGVEDQYWAIDGDKWPPKALLRVNLDDCVVLVTVGVSIRPQPRVEMAFEEPGLYRRIELAMALSTDTPEPVIEAAASYLAITARLPWSRYTWLGENHTVLCGAFTSGDYLKEVAAVLLLANIKGAPELSLPPLWGDPVRVLWMLGITEEERDIAIKHGSQKLLARLESLGRGWINGRKRSES